MFLRKSIGIKKTLHRRNVRFIESNNLDKFVYCADKVRKQDYENFLCGSLFPIESRKAYFAVRALNIELANIKEISSNVQIGSMRLDWWKDAIKLIYKGIPPEHPVTKALFESIQNFRLTQSWFLKLIDQRNRDIENQPIRNIQDIENYAENSASVLLYLGLECLGVRNLDADHAVSHIGKANGISILLRATPYHNKRRICYLPLDIMAKHSVSQEDLFRNSFVPDRLREVIYDVASVANDHLRKSRELNKEIPKEALPALQSSAISDIFLTNLRKTNFNIYDETLTKKIFCFTI